MLHSLISFTVPLEQTDCSLDTRYDSRGLTCLATHAIDATTLLRHVVSVWLHLSTPRLFSPMSIGRIFSVLSLAVTVIEKSSCCSTSFPQNRNGGRLRSRTENLSRILSMTCSCSGLLPNSKSSTFDDITPTIFPFARRVKTVGRMVFSV